MILDDIYYVTSYTDWKKLTSLTPSSKFILYVLKQNGPLKKKEILSKTLLPKRTVAYSLKKLQDESFIKKDKDDKDKRVSIFEACC